MNISIVDIKKLREITSAGVMDCRRALSEAGGDHEKAKKLLDKWGVERAVKKAGRKTQAGLVASYVHAGRIGALTELNCETDFVAKTGDFVNLAKELAMQIASMNPENVDELLKQEYIRDSGLTVETLIKQAIGKLGENITVGKICRIELGER